MPEEFTEQLPQRTLDTISEAIALSSPSGRMSKRAKDAAIQRLALALFGPKGLQRGEAKQPTKVERLERKIEEFRGLASRGMQPRKFVRLANELEEKLNTLKREALQPAFPPEPQSLIDLRKQSLAASMAAGNARERAKLGTVSQSEAQKLANEADKIEVRLLDAEKAFEKGELMPKEHVKQDGIRPVWDFSKDEWAQLPQDRKLKAPAMDIGAPISASNFHFLNVITRLRRGDSVSERVIESYGPFNPLRSDARNIVESARRFGKSEGKGKEALPSPSLASMKTGTPDLQVMQKEEAKARYQIRKGRFAQGLTPGTEVEGYIITGPRTRIAVRKRETAEEVVKALKERNEEKISQLLLSEGEQSIKSIPLSQVRDRLKEIRKEQMEVDEQFFAIPLGQRNSSIADPIRDRARALSDEAERLLPKPQPPSGLGWGVFRGTGRQAYAIRIIPGSSAVPADIWGRVFLTGPDLRKDLDEAGLEIRGEFLIKKGTTSTRDAVRREFLIGPEGKEQLVRRWFEKLNISSGPQLQSISLSQAQERFAERSPRSKALDAARSAQTVAPADADTEKEKRLQQRWLKNPGRLDFEGVDTGKAVDTKALAKRLFQTAGGTPYAGRSLAEWERRLEGISQPRLRELDKRQRKLQEQFPNLRPLPKPLGKRRKL